MTKTTNHTHKYNENKHPNQIAIKEVAFKCKHGKPRNILLIPEINTYHQ